MIIPLEQRINELLQHTRIESLHIPQWFGDLKVDVLREDLIHPEVSGNKLRKLKYNLLEAEQLGRRSLLTFGGAYSNHIAATAAAGKLFGFKTIGIIRGDELNAHSNETLRKAVADGMQLLFWSREAYKRRNEAATLASLQEEYPEAFIIPEGGSNELGVQGCAEILRFPYDLSGYDFIVCPCGTATTFVGLICSLNEGQKALGISVLKENYLQQSVENQLSCIPCQSKEWVLNSTFHMGGYGRIIGPLIDFIGEFFKLSGIFAEPVYTGKMIYAIRELSQEYYFPTGSKLLLIHTGGLQGWNGYADVNPFKTRI